MVRTSDEDRLSVRIAALLYIVITFNSSAVVRGQNNLTIHNIGDSTTMLYDTTGDLRRGWAQELPKFFNPNIVFDNAALSGRSTKSFIDEGLWSSVLSRIKVNDYVLIQFGHNDELIDDTARFTSPWTTYVQNLARFIVDTKAKGGLPVLCTPIVCRFFDGEGHITEIGLHNMGPGDSVGNYPKAMRWIAKALSIPLIDLTATTKELVESYGPNYSKRLFNYFAPGLNPRFPNGVADDVHLSEYGADKIAGIAVKSLTEMDGRFVEYRVAEVIPSGYLLLQNYPNPFNPLTLIRFGIPERSKVRLTIFDVLGEKIGRLADGEYDKGFHEFVWEAPIASGIYFCRFEAISVVSPAIHFIQTRKMNFIK